MLMLQQATGCASELGGRNIAPALAGVPTSPRLKPGLYAPGTTALIAVCTNQLAGRLYYGNLSPSRFSDEVRMARKERKSPPVARPRAPLSKTGSLFSPLA